jgi:dTMP kinase
MLVLLEHWVQAVPSLGENFIRQPDLTVWFDLSAEIAAQRLAGARVPDKFESQPVEFFKRVSSGYLARMSGEPERFARINAENTREAVWLDVFNAIKTRGWLA